MARKPVLMEIAVTCCLMIIHFIPLFIVLSKPSYATPKDPTEDAIASWLVGDWQRDRTVTEHLRSANIPDLDVYSKETTQACAIAKHVPPGCSVLKACGDDKNDQGFCAPQSIWNDVCSDDLEILRRDGICEKYQDKCIESKSEECLSGLPNLPKTSDVRSLIKEMCHEMPKMKACSGCHTGECGDPFMSAYVPLCASMPNMHECGPWRNLCTLVKENEIKIAWQCAKQSSDDDDDPPPMRMYLHFSRLDYVLFSWWVPRTNLSYAIACLTCFLMGAVSSTLRICRIRAEIWWGASDEQDLQSEPEWFSMPSYATNLKRALLVAFVSMLDFTIMLLVMTFNIGIIIACVAGLAFGHFLFGHMTPRRPAPTCCCAVE